MRDERTEGHVAGSEYMEHRRLKAGAAGWVLLAGLGVSYVISGDFAGWNIGLAEGGWGGLLIAFALMGLMYTCMVFGLAELSSTLPTAGAGYGFARRALGPLGGFATGTAVLIEYAVAPAAIATFIGGYIEALGLFGLTNSWPVYLVTYLVFMGIHMYGVGEALKLMFGITAIAVLALGVTVVALLPHFDVSNLFDIVPDGSVGSSAFMPMGYAGVMSALVYGIWFFLAVEGVPLAAEETTDPKRDMPRGIIVAMIFLLVSGALMLVLVPGAAGSLAMSTSDNPLPEAIRAVDGQDSIMASVVNYAGLAGLVASFFSIMYAYSRQLFALSRAGYLPRFLSLTGKQRTPWVALLVPGTIGFILAAVTKDGGLLINIAVFGATVSYVLLNLSHIVLRFREPELPRGYRTPGGVLTTGIAMVLAIVAVVATFLVDVLAASITAGVFLVFLAYFWFYSRHHLVANAPEEEFALVEGAETDLQ
ncbi:MULTISPECIES: ethanolamine permease [Kocuria]|uniref:ethanolamine permease n=1 Tax=Kocuria TaxID=57493 RepID=UPI000F5497F3|nr:MULTISPECIES: ethanolamine permease [Kocuria]MCT1545161.1 ethanolamine permease [Kocuria rhizophila]MCT2170472.1 ethanolamine permease [Kocuria rhizophila]MDN3462715.1 ethanolamine permease [Kocuria sp. APC 4018]MXN61182.1 ethanolamine permease [Bacillus sp. BGMRC0062]